jgi:multidrug efflux pump subunit AcrB
MTEARPPEAAREGRGPIVWMTHNRVAANLLMIVLMVGGLLTIPRITKEVFPTAELDVVTVRLPYPGASPEEVEQGVILAVEEAVRGLEGVKEVRSFADEGVGLVNVELMLGQSRDQKLDEVQSEVGRITSFPQDAERPTVSLASTRRQVISLIYHGDVKEKTLRDLVERAREQLLARPEITLVELAGVRPLEIAIEVSQDTLRRYGLTLQGVAETVSAASIDLPAGDIATARTEIALRTTERAETARAFERVELVSRPDGTRVRLADVATVRDTFEDIDQAAFYDGRLAARIDVYRVGDQSPLEVADAVKAFARQERARLPPNVGVAIWNDQSQIYADRMGLLLRNGLIGLTLVLLVLGLALEPRLAFWVTLGIPISFLGGLLFLPAADVTINLISLFAFIVTLGLVVDDAIVVGESVYRRRQQGAALRAAAIEGTREVARPVVFSILTTCTAFAPMLFVPGVAGQFFRNIPIVVILVLLASLAESLLVLPAHLSHPMPRLLALVLTPFLWLMSKLRSDRVSVLLDRFIERRYVPAVRRAVRYRYVTIAIGVFLVLGALGLQLGGRIGFTFLPRIEADEVTATLEMQVGTPFSITRDVAAELSEVARSTVAELAGPTALAGIYTEIGVLTRERTGDAAPPRTGSHFAQITVHLGPAGERDFRSSEFAERWRRAVGDVNRAQTLTYSYSLGATEGPPITLRLSHPDISTLEAAAADLADALRIYRGVRDVDEGFSYGKQRIDVELTPEGRAHGLTSTQLARELRGAFFGAEAQRFQRDRNEVRVYVRLPESERASLDALESLIIRTPQGGEIPLRRAADLRWGRAFTRIERTAMQRTINVTADIAGGITANQVVTDLSASFVPRLLEKYPELTLAPGGQQEAQAESLENLGAGFLLALIAMFALLAVAFRSYVQPLIVLCAIPFGMIGAVLGHLLLGYDLSLSSLFGLVALSGVVVNDSLLIGTAINAARERERDLVAATVQGAARRFRPVLLTSLTTFFGLSPMIFETSVQARFLIPMAISLGFGILFATLILAFIVPCLYLAVEDARRGVQRGLDRALGEPEPPEPAADQTTP